MAYNPPFMIAFDAFKADRAGVKTVDNWQEFRRKWFDFSFVPERIQPARMLGDLPEGDWDLTFWAYDLTPEARYEYFWTMHEIGDKIMFSFDGESLPGARRECGFCEISTGDTAVRSCPKCERNLYLVVYND